MCGTCHTVHVPILHGANTIGHAYEQTTYPEWAFSDLPTGNSVDGVLPYGSGPQAQSCQSCHMPNKDVMGNPYRSKIAAIQEYSNFPQAEHTLPKEDIDLQERSGFGKHTLVGLNVYLLKMAWQFPDILGIRKTDPMLSSSGINSIPTAEFAMLDQAVNRTATVTVADVRNQDGALNARVTVINKVGHKFPSGVGFRRAFLEFSVLDVNNKVIWSSGSTNSMGLIVDGKDKLAGKDTPIAGELWWNDSCTARIEPEKRIHQPHYQDDHPAGSGTDLSGTGCPSRRRMRPGKAAARMPTPQGPLTTSFLSICAKVKDNRLLPAGFLPLEERKLISKALGADDKMAEESGPDDTTAREDPDYRRGGGDSLIYRVPLSELDGKRAAAVQATLYYQATPPFFLQDRFCTSKSTDTQRLYYLAGKLNLAGTIAQDWKLRVVTSGPVTLCRDQEESDRRRRVKEIAHRVPQQVAVVAVADRVRGVRQDHELAVAVGKLRVEIEQVLIGRIAVVLGAQHQHRRLHALRIDQRQVHRHVEIGAGRHLIAELQFFRRDRLGDRRIVGRGVAVAREDRTDHREVTLAARACAIAVRDRIAPRDLGRAGALIGECREDQPVDPLGRDLCVGAGADRARRCAIHMQLLLSGLLHDDRDCGFEVLDATRDVGIVAG